jgi:protocatechuate 3,4-dioxygenase beta subunit
MSLALAFTASSLWAQAPSASSSGYRIAGRVVDAVTGEPVSRATLTVLSEDYKVIASAATDAEGRFSFEHIAAGKYPLSAAKRGYRTSYYDEHDNFNSAIVTGDGQDTGNLLFRLPASAVLRGVVTADGGDPVENAQVMLFRKPTDGENNGHMQQRGGVQTDDTGAYEFNDLTPGEYYIAVKGEPWYAQHGDHFHPRTTEPSPLDVAYPITYFDSTIDENAASPITLSWGAREQADINLHAVPAVVFRIPVARPGPQITLQQKVFGNLVNQQAIGLGDGPVSGALDIPGFAPGNYEIELGNPPRRMTVDAASEVDLDLNSGMPLLSVEGTLVMAGGEPIPDDISVVLTSDDGGVPVQTDMRKGKFEANAVSPGTWSIAAGSPRQPLAVVATSTGGAATAGNKIVVRDRPAQVTVVLGGAQTRVQGFAKRDGKGVSGAMIMLVPVERSAYPVLARRDQSDSDGSFSLNDVPAGKYTVVAIDDGWNLEWQRREVIEPYLHNGAPVTITGQSAPVINLSQPVPVATAQ